MAGSAAERLRNPWWLPPFLGRVPPDVEREHLRLLGFVGFAMLFENYDVSLLGAALPLIAKDFDLDPVGLAEFTSILRLGTLPAFLLVLLADRIGRRRLFLLSVAGLSIGAFLTAFSQSAAQFLLFQILSRSFMVAASTTAFVIITEEFPASRRGWGIGILGAVASFGHGLAALLYAGVESLPFGWRTLYALGVAPILFLPLFRRGIPETQRFEMHLRDSGDRSLLGLLRPILELARSSPRRALGIAALGAVSTAGHAVAFQFLGYFVQQVRDWSPGQYSAMFVIGGGIGIVGSPVAGRLGDRFGRRVVALVVLCLFPLFAFTVYLGPGLAIPPGWVGMVFLSMAATVVVRSLATELFPTSHRATAGGTLSLVETLGAAAGLLAYGALQAHLDQQGLAIALVTLLTPVSGAALLLLPETRRRELEDISSDPQLKT